MPSTAAAVPAPLQVRRKVLAGERPAVPPREALPGPDTAEFAGLDDYCQLMRCGRSLQHHMPAAPHACSTTCLQHHMPARLPAFLPSCHPSAHLQGLLGPGGERAPHLCRRRGPPGCAAGHAGAP